MAIGLEGRGRHPGVILNGNGQVVAHVWGHVKIVNSEFRYVPKGRQAALMASGSPKMKANEMKGFGAAEEEASLF
jgi:hypothetical protein